MNFSFLPSAMFFLPVLRRKAFRRAMCISLAAFMTSAGAAETATQHTLDLRPGNAVNNLRSEFDGEYHEITVKYQGGTLERTEGDGALWKLKTANPPIPGEAVYAASSVSATENLAAAFKVKPAAVVATGGGGGVAPAPSAAGNVNQIQIHAYAPGSGSQPSQAFLMPRPLEKGAIYYGVIQPYGAGATPLKLVLNKPQQELGANRVTLTIPDGVDVQFTGPAPTSSQGNLRIWDHQAFQNQTILISSKAGQVRTSPAEFKLSLQNALGNTVEDAVALMPIEINSMDRFLAGSVPQPLVDALGGSSKFGLVFRNSNSGETYEFGKLSEAHVYDNPLKATPDEEDAFLSNEEIKAWANGHNTTSKELNQEVVFYRQNGALHFRGLFDEVGNIEIGLIKDGVEICKVPYKLTPEPHIGHLLETVDSILAGTWGDSGGVILSAMQSGVNAEDIEAMRSVALASAGDNSGGGFTGFLRRNLTIKVNIPTWEAVKDKFAEGARKAGEVVEKAIVVVAMTGKGFAEGAWMGVKDDASSLVEIAKMIANPAETAKTFYEGFKVLIDLDVEGWKNVGKTLVQSFLDKGEEGVNGWAEPSDLNVGAYLVGFTAGFITEQIAVSYVTAGLLKAGNVGAKIGQFIRNAAAGLKSAMPTVAEAGKLLYQKVLKAKNSIFRKFSQDVGSIEDVKAFKRMLQELEIHCPAPN